MSAPEPDPDPAPSKPLLSVGFWIALAFGAAMILAGAAVGLAGAHLFPSRAPAGPHAEFPRTHQPL